MGSCKAIKSLKYKILIFDLDDTLIDNLQNVKAAFKEMVEAEKLEYSDAEFERWYEVDKKFWIDWQDGKIELPESLQHETGKKSDEFLDWVRSQRVLIFFGNSVKPERAIRLNNIYMNALNGVVLPIDGAQKTLKYLADKYTVIVATNGPQVATKEKLRKIACHKYVTEVLSADMFGFMKPKIEFFEAIEERYKDFNREDYLIIGDSLKSDVGFGMNAGIDSCWFNRTKEDIDSAYKPTMMITSLSELTDML